MTVTIKALSKDVAQNFEEFQSYSHFFNVEILGVPECVSQESALQTCNLCKTMV